MLKYFFYVYGRKQGFFLLNLFQIITKTCLYNFDPLKPHFYTVKLGFTGIYIIFLNSAQRHRLWSGSNEYSQSRFWAGILKISEFFIWKFSFLFVKFSTYLNRRVFVMWLEPDNQCLWLGTLFVVLLFSSCGSPLSFLLCFINFFDCVSL